MTHNQIEYWKLRESMRSNRANEAETNRSNVAREDETYRHNTATENEAYRHNTVGESQVWSSQTEARRHNLASEGLTAAGLDVQRQRNADQAWKEAMDVLLHDDSNKEQRRHNLAQETTDRFEAESKHVARGAEAEKDLAVAGNQKSGILKNFSDSIKNVFGIFK